MADKPCFNFAASAGPPRLTSGNRRAASAEFTVIWFSSETGIDSEAKVCKPDLDEILHILEKNGRMQK